MYIFGDGLSTTNDNTSGLSYYHGRRYTNGRVWVEVLAQRQGLIISNNFSYFDHNSATTATDVKNFTISQAVASNALFVVWVGNSDTYDAATAATPLTFAQWQATNALSQANHFQIITNLYAKGVRTLVMPNVVDVSEIPAFDAGTLAPVIHAGCVDYNIKFSNAVSQARALCPGLRIYVPDFFSLLNNVLTNAASYGLTNALYNGFSISAAQTISPLTVTNNPATNYIYWDTTDPSAKFHAVIADVAQQVISPVQISGITMSDGSNRLDVASYPAGLHGWVDAGTNLTQANWAAAAIIDSTNTTQSVFIPVSGPQQYYRLRFPFAWSYP
jgi:hypothetical protein